MSTRVVEAAERRSTFRNYPRQQKKKPRVLLCSKKKTTMKAV
jgi:hypothetical protein